MSDKNHPIKTLTRRQAVTKKMKRDRKPTPVDDSVAEAMDVRLAYKNLIDSFVSDQQNLEERISEIQPQEPNNGN